MDSTTFDSEEEDEWSEEEGEWSTAQPRVWTFQFNFSKKYIEAALSRYGIEYSFDSHRSEGTLKQNFLKTLKIEQYKHRMRIHTWEVPEDGEHGFPGLYYYWFDIHTNLHDHILWSYSFENTMQSNFFSMNMSLDWKNKYEMRDLYRCIKWTLVEFRSSDFSTKETFFEIPLDVFRLGKKEGDMFLGDGQIYYMGYTDCTRFEDEEWCCSSREGWNWWLGLKTFDSSGIVIRKQR